MKTNKVQIERQAATLVKVVASVMVTTILLVVILVAKFGVANLM